MSFWDNALPLMDAKNIKQADLVRLTGKAKSTVWNWLQNGTIPQADDALLVADLLGVSIRYLVTGQDDADLSTMEKKILGVCKGLTDEQMNSIVRVIKEMKLGWHQVNSGADSPDSSVSGE